MRLVTIVFLVVTVLWVPVDIVFWIRFLQSPQERKRRSLTMASMGIVFFFISFGWLLQSLVMRLLSLDARAAFYSLRDYTHLW